jgi:adenylosuccinate lyase
MELNSLTAIGPVDGRYHKQTASLANYFSEFALIKYRVWVEVEYLIALAEKPLPQLANAFSDSHKQALRNLYLNFNLTQAQQIKDTEKVTNHDVKAVEYFLKDALKSLGLGKYEEFVHFGLTSQDINNTAIPMSLRQGWEQAVMPVLESVLNQMQQQAKDWEHIPMLARTHGQPASPTRLGKEWQVFVARLEEQVRQLSLLQFPAKFGGATGNFNAHHVAYPSISWVDFGNDFCKQLGLQRSHPTTQIEHYDNLAALFDNYKRINTILLDFSKDVWQYVAMDYFKQKLKAGEIGSSAMPHKVNPIDFENAEGNLGIANALLIHLSEKLPISRLQRDLTDSTVLRNLGVPLGHMLIAYQSLLKGMGKLLLNEAKLEADLSQNWAVVAEAIQTILRREGYEKPYEALKELTRTNEAITQESIKSFIFGLNLKEDVKEELLRISPHNYTGI